MSVKCIPPLTKLLYRKTAVCRGVPNFLFFAPKFVSTMYVLSKNIKNIRIFLVKFSFFTAEKKNLCILHRIVFILLISACDRWTVLDTVIVKVEKQLLEEMFGELVKSFKVQTQSSKKSTGIVNFKWAMA